MQSLVLDKYLGLLADQAVVLAASGNHDLDGPGEHGEQVAGWLRRPRAAPSTSTVSTSTSTAPASRSAPGGTARRPATRSPRSSPPPPSTGRSAGSGSTTRRRPARSLCKDGRREFPDHELAAWIAEHQPDVVLCGHIHQAPWVEGGSWHARLGRTWVFNAGKQVGPVPPHITLDIEAATADWFGVFESETISLA